MSDAALLKIKQQRKLRKFIAKLVSCSPFYQRFEPDIKSFPVMNKASFLHNFADLNQSGVALETATELALRAERERNFSPVIAGGITVGLSSGTSGKRHVFLVSRADRCRWAGQMLGRMLTRASLLRVINPFAKPLKIAFFLRANSNLYTTLASSRVDFAYYDLTKSFHGLVEEVTRQQPHLLVAPATVLAELARARVSIRPQQVISVAEVLDDRDRAQIEEAFGIRVAEIYQAAEGFLGCSCEHGRVHLNEDSLHVEPLWLDEERSRFHPIITDFSRSAQWFVRYQLDDILRVNPVACPCGRATTSLYAVEGRVSEVLWLRSQSGELSPVFPDALRQAIYGMVEPPEMYRVEQHGDVWEIRLRNGDEKCVTAAFEQLIAGLELIAPTLVFLPWTDQASTEKQKRFHCVNKPT